jgi:radical SAM superfamily enzyme YgiQ (UPF0313 family)
MKISLLKAPIGGIIGLEMITFVEPLGLECVAGGLELEGHFCQIVDMRIDGVEPGFAKVRAFAPDIIGLQCNFTTERFRSLRLARRIKQDFPDVLVVLGGHDASRDPRWFLKPGIDVIVVGDGEEVMPLLVSSWEKTRDLSKVPGLLISESISGTAPIDTGHAGDRARLSVQVQLLFGVEVSREHVPREIAGARGRGIAPDRSAERVHHGRHFLDEREARPGDGEGAH